MTSKNKKPPQLTDEEWELISREMWSIMSCSVEEELRQEAEIIFKKISVYLENKKRRAEPGA